MSFELRIFSRAPFHALNVQNGKTPNKVATRPKIEPINQRAKPMKKRFLALDSFRGIAALSVVIYHLNILGSPSEFDFFRGSYILVEFFFVLSGFVLTHGYGFKEELKFAPFIKSRIFRLYPLHLVMLFVFLILELFKGLVHNFGLIHFNNAPFSGRSAISEILPNALLIQSWTMFTDPVSFNSPSWSISVELFLYVLLFLSLSILYKFRTLIWIAFPVLSFYIILFVQQDMITDQILRGLACFFGGSLTYLVYKSINIKKVPPLIANVLEFSTLFLVFITVKSSFEYRNLVAPILFYWAILLFSFELGIVSRVLKAGVFQHLGKVSYSIYMTHMAVLHCVTFSMIGLQKITGNTFAPTIGGRPFITFNNNLANNILFFAILISVVFISQKTHQLIELKGQQFGRQRFNLYNNLRHRVAGAVK